MQYLVVVRPFGSYRTGDVVSDEKAIEQIVGSEHVDHVVRITPPKEG